MSVQLTKATDTVARIERALAGAEKRILQSFMQLIRSVVNERTAVAIANMLERGAAIEEVLVQLEGDLGLFVGDVADEYIRSGREAAAYISETAGTVIAFDVSNLRAVNYLRQNRFRLIREFTRAQIAATREALVAGAAEGLNPIAMARRFRESIGLTEHQTRIVNNYRGKLEAGNLSSLQNKLRDKRFDRSVVRAANAGEVLSPAQIEKMTGRYRDRMLSFRAKTIARTEALRAVNSGTKELFDQAMDNGTIQQSEVLRTWHTASDERVRSTHSSINQVTNGPNVPFITEAGNVLMFPGDPTAPPEETIQCRCVLTTVLTPIRSEAAA